LFLLFSGRKVEMTVSECNVEILRRKYFDSKGMIVMEMKIPGTQQMKRLLRPNVDFDVNTIIINILNF